MRAIDFRDERFRTSYFFSLEGMIQSIKKVGVLNPPRLQAEKGGWVIVAGWKRLLACREVGLDSISGLEVPVKKALDGFLGALEENLLTRELGLLEKSIALLKLERFGVKRERLVREFMPWLGLPATLFHLDMLQGLARTDVDTKRFVAEKNPPFVLVEQLLSVPRKDRKLVLPFLYRLGQNKQKEFLGDLLSISLREGVSPGQILAEAALASGVAEGNLPGLEQAEKLRQELRRRRYPQLSRLRAAFAAARKKLPFPESILVEPDPFFEDSALTVSFRCRTRAEFRERLAELQAIAEKDSLSRLFRVGRET